MECKLVTDIFSPYKDKEGNGKYIKSFCAFIDILGFSNIVDSEDLNLFDKYLDTLNNLFDPWREDSTFFRSLDRISYKIFTDNFVFAIPLGRTGEGEFGELTDILSQMQYHFIMHGFFIRGGIALSNLYLDEHTVLGPALIEAYRLESHNADVPRIILANNVIEKVHEYNNFYGNYSWAFNNSEYIVDNDGSYVLNYLYSLLEYEDSILLEEELNKHKAVVIEKLIEHKDNYHILKKYNWVAKYHNYFCEEFVFNNGAYQSIEESILIDVHLFENSFKRIIQS